MAERLQALMAHRVLGLGPGLPLLLTTHSWRQEAEAPCLPGGFWDPPFSVQLWSFPHLCSGDGADHAEALPGTSFPRAPVLPPCSLCAMTISLSAFSPEQNAAWDCTQHTPGAHQAPAVLGTVLWA